MVSRKVVPESSLNQGIPLTGDTPLSSIRLALILLTNTSTLGLEEATDQTPQQ